MKRIVFDIETTAMDFKSYDLPWRAKGTAIHCICTYDLDSGEERLFGYGAGCELVSIGIDYLNSADLIIGHNIQGFDIPVIEHVIKTKITAKPFDTYLISKMMFFNKYDNFSLKSWGQRLGEHKLEYTGGFDKLTEDMIVYCKQDVKTTAKLYQYLTGMSYSQQAIDLETDVARITQEQIGRGVGFDVAKAESLYLDLKSEQDRLRQELTNIFPPEEVQLKTKTKLKPFNPGSGKQIAKRLIEKYNWKPTKLTEKGNICVDGEVLQDLDYPEAQAMFKYSNLKKLIGMLGEGKEAWLKTEVNGRIYGRVNTIGAVTGRMSHERPNLGQVYSERKYRGEECRKLFIPTKGKVLVGCDLKGIEARIISHYFYKFDNGAMIQEILAGDIHTRNAQFMYQTDTPTKQQRADAKAVFFGFVYGAQIPRIQETLKTTEFAAREIFNNLTDAYPFLEDLRKWIRTAAERGFIYGIDGRQIPIEKVKSKKNGSWYVPQSCVNYAVQSGGAIAAKQSLVCMETLFLKNNIPFDIVLNVHDEFQVEADLDKSEKCAILMKEGIVKAGEILGLKCPLEGETKIGQNWYETH